MRSFFFPKRPEPL